MRQVRVRELQPYSLYDLTIAFKLSQEEASDLVHALINRGAVKLLSKEDADDWFREGLRRNGERRYQFTFVGIIIWRDLLIVSYPKYFRNGEPPLKQLHQILQVVRKQNSSSMGEPSFNELGSESDDLLPLMFRLIELYDEYGEYTNSIENFELNGLGQIDWGRTISLRQPLFFNGEPVYVEYDSRKSRRDELDYVTRLHRCMLTTCSRDLREWGVSDLLALDDIWLSDEELETFGDVETIAWQLEREKSVQFVTWKQEVLDVLERLVLKQESQVDKDELECFGTTSFYNAWEIACKVAYGDELNSSLPGIGLGNIEYEEWRSRSNSTDPKLIDIIPQPYWVSPNSSDDGVVESRTSTLIPDAICIRKRSDGTKEFWIYDAKDYVPSWTKDGPKRVPGVESVTKQILYQSAYRKFILDQGFSSVKNLFLMPSAGAKPQLFASVSFPGVFQKLDSPFSNYIDVWEIPADMVFKAYLENRTLAEEERFGIFETVQHDQIDVKFDAEFRKWE